MGMGNKSADLVPQTFIMRIGWNVRVCNKNADHADLFRFAKKTEEIPPPSGDANRSEFLPHFYLWLVFWISKVSVPGIYHCLFL